MVDDNANAEDFAFGDGDDDAGVPSLLPWCGYRADGVASYLCADDIGRDDADGDDRRAVENPP